MRARARPLARALVVSTLVVRLLESASERLRAHLSGHPNGHAYRHLNRRLRGSLKGHLRGCLRGHLRGRPSARRAGGVRRVAAALPGDCLTWWPRYLAALSPGGVLTGRKGGSAASVSQTRCPEKGPVLGIGTRLSDLTEPVEIYPFVKLEPFGNRAALALQVASRGALEKCPRLLLIPHTFGDRPLPPSSSNRKELRGLSLAPARPYP